ncbi:hypothetical protein BU24DRAFT_454992 [Aaosphaeria arxii CBS 175.79]|uniref:SNF2 N-terminal domain-containing protein n=1 Tax=Aaosphaeria arxii CBS 175.79 TaxID=1450172 RepID=A0A6A5XCU8_9PLEO|nr:uncharacterized protein BU24DRAFT_454992 [Aaosphaeria arxii CBS 175.79]KAF2010693.1 hypothetical protein BU24DRAFT_454992 [Aaosphaeria arxii CBS 175.79]
MVKCEEAYLIYEPLDEPDWTVVDRAVIYRDVEDKVFKNGRYCDEKVTELGIYIDTFKRHGSAPLHIPHTSIKRLGGYITCYNSMYCIGVSDHHLLPTVIDLQLVLDYVATPTNHPLVLCKKCAKIRLWPKTFTMVDADNTEYVDLIYKPLNEPERTVIDEAVINRNVDVIVWENGRDRYEKVTQLRIEADTFKRHGSEPLHIPPDLTTRAVSDHHLLPTVIDLQLILNYVAAEGQTGENCSIACVRQIEGFDRQQREGEGGFNQYRIRNHSHRQHFTFIFSDRCHHARLDRPCRVIARCASTWRPWSTHRTSHNISVESTENSQRVDLRLTPAVPPIERTTALVSAFAAKEVRRCDQSIPILEVTIPDVEGAFSLATHSWALEYARIIRGFSEWSDITACALEPMCDCAPSIPRPLYSINGKGEAIAQVDEEAIAEFERRLRPRGSIFTHQALREDSKGRLQMIFNIAALLHRARSHTETQHGYTAAWRLISDHVDESAREAPKGFQLQSRSSQTPYTGNLSLKHDLSTSQEKSLSWIIDQEKGKTLAIQETEEAIDAQLHWRADVRIQHKTVIRGGILADLPSFGKTVTTIALIQREYEIDEVYGVPDQGFTDPLGLVSTAATLVVCPQTLYRRWQDEFVKFLGKTRCSQMGVRAIGSMEDLRRTTIADIQNSRVVIVPWNVLADDKYVRQLADFTTMPKLALKQEKRAFNSWLNYVNSEIPSRVQELVQEGVRLFKRGKKEALEARLKQPGFKGVVPLKPQHGSAYQSYKGSDHNSQMAPVQGTDTTKPKRTNTSRDGDWMSYCPPLHIFAFNRIVIDEYHYLCSSDPKNSAAYALIKAISGHGR